MTSRDPLGFGTYTWDLSGPVDAMEPSVVLGLRLSGPAAGLGKAGENEVAIEFTRWSSEVPGDNAEFTVYPNSGQNWGGNPSYETGMVLDLKGDDRLTVELAWGPTKMALKLTDRKGRLLRHTVVVPEDPENVIPRVPVPLTISLWSYGAQPTRDLDIQILDFRFTPLR